MKLLFVVTEDWYFVSHRLTLAVAAREAGFDVAVATRVDRHGEKITSAGIRLIPFVLSRRGGNPMREFLALVRLYRQECPDLVHLVALKPVVLGALAARIAGVSAWVNSVAGLGWLFTASHGLLRALRPLLRWVLARILDQKRSLTIVQNPDDFDLLQRAGVTQSRLRLIRGAGVDVECFAPPVDTPAGKPTIMLAARMLWGKGVAEFVDAAQRLHSAGVTARFVLVGEPDPANPSSVPEETLRDWHGKNGIEWWGRSDDMVAAYSQARIACLPSYYGEGVPKSLLEAAACGLPIVTTDTPGCREVVSDGENGLLVQPRDAQALAAALAKLIADPALCKQMGRQGRIRAERKFALPAIIKQTLSVYREALP